MMIEYTQQSMFDAIVEHSRKMTEQCYSEDKGMCLYRGANGNKCFIGALIPDEAYSEDLEAKNGDEVFNILSNRSILQLVEYDKNFINKLQGIHDNHFDDRENALRRFAIDYNLTIRPNDRNDK